MLVFVTKMSVLTLMISKELLKVNELYRGGGSLSSSSLVVRVMASDDIGIKTASKGRKD